MGEQKELADASRVDAIREHLHEWEREGALDTGKRYALQLLALIDGTRCSCSPSSTHGQRAQERRVYSTQMGPLPKPLRCAPKYAGRLKSTRREPKSD